MPTAFTLVPVPQSPPRPRFLSPLLEPSVRFSCTGLSSEILPSPTGSCPGRTPRRSRPWPRHGRPSGKRTSFPDFTRCFRLSHRRDRSRSSWQPGAPFAFACHARWSCRTVPGAWRLPPVSRVPCWNSDCFVRVGSHCSCDTAGQFLTHIRWPTRTRNGAAIPISLFRQHLRHRCGSLLGPALFFLAEASLRPNVTQARRGNVQYNSSPGQPPSAGSRGARLALLPGHNKTAPPPRCGLILLGETGPRDLQPPPSFRKRFGLFQTRIQCKHFHSRPQRPLRTAWSPPPPTIPPSRPPGKSSSNLYHPNAHRIRWKKTAASIRVVPFGNISTMGLKIGPPAASDRKFHVRRLRSLGPQDICLEAPEPFSGRYRPEIRVRLGEPELPIDSHQTVVNQNPFWKEFVGMFSGTPF